MTVLNLQISADADDGRWSIPSGGGSPGGFSTTSIPNVGRSGSTGTTLWKSWLRFTGVSIPGDATIDTATLTMRASITADTSTANHRFIGGNVDNATNPGNADACESYARTAVSVAWNNVPSFTSGVDYTAPNLSTVVGAVIGRGGWASGNALIIFWEENGSSAASVQRTIQDGGDGAGAPRLVIEYTITVEGPNSEGPNSPSASSTDASVGTGIWASVNQIYTSNDSYASASVDHLDQTQWIIASDFDFNVPGNAVIVGVLVEVEVKGVGGPP